MGDSKHTKQLLLIGLTGAGKSTFGSLLLQGEECTKETAIFPASSFPSSYSQDVRTKTSQWLGGTSAEQVTVIDTPAMDETLCTNDHQLVSVMEKIRELKYMNAFIMVINGKTTTFSEDHRQLITIFQSVFGINFFTHLVIVFNRWSVSEHAQERRIDEGTSEEIVTQKFNHFIRQTFPCEFPPAIGDIPCYFLDSWDYIKRRAGHFEMEKMLQSLWARVHQMPVYYTSNMFEFKKIGEGSIAMPEKLQAELDKMKNHEKIAERMKELERLNAEINKLQSEPEERASWMRGCGMFFWNMGASFVTWVFSYLRY